MLDFTEGPVLHPSRYSGKDNGTETILYGFYSG